MDTFIGLITVIVIIGLVKPSLILRWDKNPTRLKVLGYGIVLGAIIGLWNFATGVNERMKLAFDQGQIKDARELMDKEMYVLAREELNEIDSLSPVYEEALILIREIDSIQPIYNKRRNDELRQEAVKDLKQKLINEMEFITTEFDSKKYRGSIALMQVELALFESWGRLIKEGEASSDSDVKLIASKLKRKVKSIQQREFPKLRAEYVKIAKQEMWIEDIEVTSYRSTITFTGGTFAANRNIAEFNETISKTLKSFRFTRVNYKWSEYASEYSYFTLNKGKDSDI